MASDDIKLMLVQLGSDIDDLEVALEPLLNNKLQETASKLPLLDRAKLQVLTAYAIESLIFSSLQINGVDAKEHPVWTELARVKQYFEKIAEAEKLGNSSSQPKLSLDKSAANRFIKHGLSGNDKLDREREARAMDERANAQIKLQNLEEDIEARKLKANKLVAKQARLEGKRKADEASTDTSGITPSDSSTVDVPKKKKKSKYKEKVKHKSDKAPKLHNEIFKDLVGRADKRKGAED